MYQCVYTCVTTTHKHPVMEDKVAIKCTIGYSPSASDTPALPMIYEGLNELVQEGHMTERGVKMLVLPDDGVVYAYASDPRDLVGVLCFSRHLLTNSAVVSLGYVEPSSRRMGVFRQMWEELLARLKEQGIEHVSASVHALNMGGMDALQAVGCAPVVHTYGTRIA